MASTNERQNPASSETNRVASVVRRSMSLNGFTEKGEGKHKKQEADEDDDDDDDAVQDAKKTHASTILGRWIAIGLHIVAGSRSN